MRLNDSTVHGDTLATAAEMAYALEIIALNTSERARGEIIREFMAAPTVGAVRFIRDLVGQKGEVLV